MIRTILVDGTPADALRTKALLEQYAGSIEIISTVQTGSDALLCLQSGGIDAVVTETSLPDMSGLSLIKQITTLFPDCIAAVVTHEADFNAASAALRFGVADYRIKPLDAADAAALSALVEAIYIRRCRYHIFTNNRPSAAQPSPPPNERIGICLFAVGGIQRPGTYSTHDPWGNTDIEKVAREIVSDALSFVWSFDGFSPSERVLFYQQNGRLDIDWLQCLYRNVSREIGLPINALAFDSLFSMDQLSSKTRLARTMLRRRCTPGNGQLFIVSPVESTENPHVAKHDLADALADALAGRVPCEPLLSTLFSVFKKDNVPYSHVEEIFLHACIRADLSNGNTFASAIVTALSWDDMHRRISELLGVDVRSVPPYHRTASLPENVAAYLEENYQKPITHKTLSIIFGYVPSYLSALFAKSYGLSPADYLTRVRIEKAEQLLQEHPQMHIRDVAEAVGFKSPNHFSRAFKKHRGYSPIGARTTNI